MRKSRLWLIAPSVVRRASVIPVSAVVALTALTPTSTQTAVANGDTRTLYLHHAHTGETITATFRVNGSYDQATLDKLNHFLRDWRNDAVIKMDPRLFDVVWETHRGAGSTSPIRINSAYRSPETNSMLRRRSRGVAEYSLHTRGMAMDIHVPDVSTDRLRETAIRMQRGGVGFYPSSGFVHLDVGNVRAWPRMRYDQLARIFPDGKTVHIATDGRTLPGYEEARVALAARNGSYAPTLAQVKSKGFFATLFGWEEPDDTPAPAPARRAPAPTQVAANTTQVAAFAPQEQPRSAALARAEANRPRGETFIGPAPQTAPAAASAEAARATLAANVPMPPRRPAETVVASLNPAPVLGPLPPARPADLVVASIVPASAPLPPARSAGAEVASLFGGAPAGKVAGTPGLPPVITEGTQPIAPGVLAYAPHDAAPRMMKQARTAPMAAQPVGLRTARNRVASSLTPARLDRSNFLAMTAPSTIAEIAPASTLGSTIAPLRPAARGEARELMFGSAQGPLVVSELRPRQ